MGHHRRRQAGKRNAPTKRRQRRTASRFRQGTDRLPTQDRHRLQTHRPMGQRHQNRARLQPRRRRHHLRTPRRNLRLRTRVCKQLRVVHPLAQRKPPPATVWQPVREPLPRHAASLLSRHQLSGHSQRQKSPHLRCGTRCRLAGNRQPETHHRLRSAAYQNQKLSRQRYRR